MAYVLEMARNRSFQRPPCVQAAINKAGSMTALAEIVGVTPAAVRQWRMVPVQHVHALSEALELPLYELLPKRTPVKEAAQ